MSEREFFMRTTAIPVQITLLGHSCVLFSIGRSDNQRRLVLDPGNLTSPLSDVGQVDAVLVTHAHADHVDADQIRLLRQSAAFPVFGNEDVLRLLADAGIPNLTLLEPGPLTVAGVKLEVLASVHESIYPGVPVPTHSAFLIADTVFAPGDAFLVPDFPVDVLMLATGAPWMKLADTIDYLRAVNPRVAVPVHDGGLAPAHQALHRALIAKFAPMGTTVLNPGRGQRIDTATLLPTP